MSAPQLAKRARLAVVPYRAEPAARPGAQAKAQAQLLLQDHNAAAVLQLAGTIEQLEAEQQAMSSKRDELLAQLNTLNETLKKKAAEVKKNKAALQRLRLVEAPSGPGPRKRSKRTSRAPKKAGAPKPQAARKAARAAAKIVAPSKRHELIPAMRDRGWGWHEPNEDEAARMADEVRALGGNPDDFPLMLTSEELPPGVAKDFWRLVLLTYNAVCTALTCPFFAATCLPLTPHNSEP